jgi:transposase
VEKFRLLTIAAIGLEPSGGYERGVIRALRAAGFAVRRIVPHTPKRSALNAATLTHFRKPALRQP